MGAGITWTEGLSSDRPGMEKGLRSGPLEHLGSSGPFPTELEDLSEGQGWPCHQPGGEGGDWGVLSTQTSLTNQPAGPPALSSIQIELASHQGGATASDTTYPLE